MKILHLCLSAFYIDNNSYQENILPKMHKKMGHEVLIVASTETYIDKKEIGYVEPSKYLNEDGIKVVRIPYARLIPRKMVHKLRIYRHLYDELECFSPDFIFIHDVQFLSILTVKKYLKRHSNVKAVADGHTDFCNSARNFFSYRILHGIVYKFCAKTIEPYVNHFFGTLPARVDFFINVYHIKKNKVSLLPMGADDDILLKIQNEQLDRKIREQYGIRENDFLIVTGGKLNRNRPEILYVLKAVAELNNPIVKVLFFGNVSDDYIQEFNRVIQSPNIINAGWQSTNKTYEYMAAGDLVFFPGLHSVMWEQAVALGKPCVFKKINGFTHVDLGGNAVFLNDTSFEAIAEVIKELVDKNNGKFTEMLCIASSSEKEKFYYSNIAQKSLRN